MQLILRGRLFDLALHLPASSSMRNWMPGR